MLGHFPLIQNRLVLNHPAIASGGLLDRERERIQLLDHLAGPARLVTVTGPPGVGRTRLASAVAADLGERSPARRLELGHEGGGWELQAVETELGDRPTLLLVDDINFVPDAVAMLTQLFTANPQVKVLATSRFALGMEGETALALGPLSSVAARALFDRRVRAVEPTDAPATEHDRMVAELCVRVQGLPLAVELLAAQSDHLTPAQILDRLPVPVALEMVLDAALDFVYGRLADDRRALLRRLAVFPATFSVQAASKVTGSRGGITGRLADLVAHDLLLVDGDDDGHGRRYRVPAPIHDYLRQRLDESGEGARIRERHARHYVGLASAAELRLTRPEQPSWVRRLEAQRADGRAALAWCREHDPEAGLRMALALREFWDIRGRYAEGRSWLEDLVVRSPESAPGLAAAMAAAGGFAHRLGDREGARRMFERSLATGRANGDPSAVAYSLQRLGFLALLRDARMEARALLEESLARYRDLGDLRQVGITLSLLGNTFRLGGEQQAARRLFEQAVDVLRRAGAQRNLALTLANLANLARMQGAYRDARVALEESLEVFQAIGDRRRIAWTLANLANLARTAGEPDEGWRRFRESLTILREIRYRPDVCFCLSFAGILAVEQGDTAEGVRLMAAGDRLRDDLSNPLDLDEQADLDSAAGMARERLGQLEFDKAWREGRSLSMDAAVAAALDRAAAAR